MPNKAGGHTAWRAAKWEDGVEALRICYPNDNLGDRSADDLSDFVQTQHADPHIRAWLQLREDVGSPVDMDSTSKLDHEALLRTRRYNAPKVQDTPTGDNAVHHEG